ncbi:MAG: hypothetical protein CW716_01985, partial [Candidatus Bathyarchaeum sp.]
MFEETHKKRLLLFLLVFAFGYRLLLMTGNIFPPGADIGLHQSVVNSISISNSDLFMNYYHMGGGVSATNPGYHFFIAVIADLTGLTDFLVHSIVVSLFSAITVLSIFLIVQHSWNNSAAYIAAFLVIFSSGDISMLCWGGYPNIMALFLMPAIFYFYLRVDNFDLKKYLVITSMLTAALFLTHIFSAIIFVAITLIILVINFAFVPKTRSSRQIIAWILPLFLGAFLVSPYLVSAIPLYFGSESTITGTVLETKQTVLATRLIPIEFVIFSVIPILLFLFFSKYRKKHFLTTSSSLFVIWIFLPAILTQSHLLGLYVDYERFQYFLYFPLMICTALAIESGSRTISKITVHFLELLKHKKKIRKTQNEKNSNSFFSLKSLHLIFVLLLLGLSLFYLPILTAPNEGLAEADFYQTMTSSRYDAIHWIKENTPEDSVLIADAEYGWWISGFSERPALSAVNPQFLILAHEIEPAQIAKNILQSDYFIDNGILRIEHYRSQQANNFFDLKANFNELLAPYSFFSIIDKQTNLIYRKNNVIGHVRLEDIPITHLNVENGSNWAEFKVTTENEQMVFSESVTVYEGVRFAKIKMCLEAKTGDLSFNWLHVPFASQGKPTQINNSIGFVDSSINVINQIIFPINGEL